MPVKKPLRVVGGVGMIITGVLLVILLAVTLGRSFISYSCGGAILGGTSVGGLLFIHYGITGEEIKWI